MSTIGIKHLRKRVLKNLLLIIKLLLCEIDDIGRGMLPQELL
jgi:hypothetical protein